MSDQGRQSAGRSRLRSWLPAAALAAIIGAAWLAGAGDLLSLGAIAENRMWLKGFTESYRLASVAIFMAAYVAVVALSLPGAAVMSILGGFLFGWALSVPVTVIAATTGATIVFQIVKTSLGAALAERAGPAVKRLADGFARDSFNYLLFLRLVPAFPFFIVNAVAGLCRVKLGAFIAATALGILPGSLAFAYLGTGLDSIIDAQQRSFEACIASRGAGNCRFELDPSALLTREIITAFVILGIIGLVPIALKQWQRRRRAP